MPIDLTQELALLNQQAADLLAKYDLAFARLDQTSQQYAQQLASQIQDYLTQLESAKTNSVNEIALKLSEALAQLNAIIESANIPIVVELPNVTATSQVAISYPSSFTFTSKSLLNNGFIDHFIVDWGDGSNIETIIANNNSATSTHTFTGQAGANYTISIIAVDNFGNKSPAKLFTVTLVNNAPPTAPTVSVPQAPVVGSFTMTISGSTDPEGQAITYEIQNIPQGFVFSKTQGIIENEQITVQVPTVTQKTIYTFDVVAVDGLGAISTPTTVSITVVPCTYNKFAYFQSGIALNATASYNELITVNDGIVLFTNNNPIKVYKFDFELNPIIAKEISFVNPPNEYHVFTDQKNIYITTKFVNTTNNIGKLYIIVLDSNLNVLQEHSFNIPANLQYYPSLVKLPDGTFVAKYWDVETIGTSSPTVPRFIKFDSSFLKTDEFFVYNNQSGYERFWAYDLDVDENGNLFVVGGLLANNGLTGSFHGVIVKFDSLLSIQGYLAVQKAAQDCNTKSRSMKYANGKLYFTGTQNCRSNFWFGEVDANTLNLLNYFNPAISGVSATDIRVKPYSIEVIGNKVYALYGLLKDINADGVYDNNIAILEYDTTTSQVSKLYTMAVKKNTDYLNNSSGITQVNNIPVVWLTESSQQIDQIIGFLPDSANVSNTDLLSPVEINIRNLNTTGLTNASLYNATLALTKTASNTVSKVAESVVSQIVDIPLPTVTLFSI